MTPRAEWLLGIAVLSGCGSGARAVRDEPAPPPVETRLPPEAAALAPSADASTCAHDGSSLHLEASNAYADTRESNDITDTRFRFRRTG